MGDITYTGAEKEKRPRARLVARSVLASTSHGATCMRGAFANRDDDFSHGAATSSPNPQSGKHAIHDHPGNAGVIA